MTTLIYDGKKLWADSRATNDNEIWISAVQKIFIPKDDEYWEVMGTKVVAFALAGNYADVFHMKDLLAKGLDHRTTMDREHSSSEILIVDELGRGYTFVGAKSPGKGFNSLLPINPPVCCGSGASYANAILALGKPADLAMKIAAKLDCYTGGEVHTFEIPPPPAVKSTRPTPIPSEPTALAEVVKEAAAG